MSSWEHQQPLDRELANAMARFNAEAGDTGRLLRGNEAKRAPSNGSAYLDPLFPDFLDLFLNTWIPN